MEPRYGRTRLASLAEYDDPEFDFLYITRFHVDDAYKQNGASDVATIALHQFLYHPTIRGNSGYADIWSVSSVAYVLDALESMTASERAAFNKHREDCRKNDRARFMRAPGADQDTTLEQERKRWDARLKVLARQDANPFLRNNFFQDLAIAKGGESDARILVASHGHSCQPLKTHAQALAVQFFVPPPVPA